MEQSQFGPIAPREADPQPATRPVGATGGRYLFSKVRLHGKLHFRKSVAPEFLFDLTTVEALRKEFEIGYDLEHPNIVRYLKYEDNALYEEYVEGQTLREMLDLKDPRLADPAFVREICGQLLDALGYIHRRGILHNDLKPENVIICDIGNSAKIIDFGAARNSLFNTTEGFTPTYKAPEQGGEGPTLVATDIYLLGRLMDELTRGSQLRALWAPFIRRATAKDPARRFPSAAEALKAIPQGSPRKSKKRWWWLAIIIAVIGLTVAAGLLFRGDSTKSDPSTPPAREETDVIDPKTVMEKAREGDPLYQEALGFMYTNGTGVMADPKKAFEWFEKAAEGGLPTAYANVGVSYRDGEGVAKDVDKAKQYFEKGAEAGDEHAAHLLALLYTRELRDYPQALEWHKRASEMGSRFSTQILLDAYSKGDWMLNVEPDPALAAKYAARLREIE